MEMDEWNYKKHDVIIEKQGIHTEKELSEFMTEEQNTRDPYDNVQYKFILITDFQPGKSALILKAHHSFTDGLGLSAFLLTISDGYDAKNLPQINPPHWLFEMMVFLMSPIMVLHGYCCVAYKSNNIHAFKHTDSPKKGIKSGAFSMDLDISKIKELCKKKQCTVNDYVMATLGTAMF